MEAFRRVEGVAAPLAIRNVDTDQLVPARFLWRTPRDGFKDAFLHDLRFRDDGAPKPEFVLNQPQYQNAQILVTERNFGCGSSREHAVWALLDIGIRTVLAPSFGDIFYNNSIKNGLLPVVLSEERISKLIEILKGDSGAEMTVDLERQEVIGPDGQIDRFEIGAFQRDCLLEGIDDTGYTLKLTKTIEEFEQKYERDVSWI